MKIVAIDGAWLYLGSANFTGAGLGAKAVGRRNFEMGIATEDEFLLDVAQGRFDQIWSGAECGSCKLRAQCPKPLDMKREMTGDMKPGPKPKTRAAERSITKSVGPRSRAKLPAK